MLDEVRAVRPVEIAYVMRDGAGAASVLIPRPSSVDGVYFLPAPVPVSAAVAHLHGQVLLAQ